MTRMIVTRGTRLGFSDLAGWIWAARQIDARRASSARYAAIARHLRALPPTMVRACDCEDTLQASLQIWVRGAAYNGFARPLRGHRANAPQTRLIMEAKNRLAHLRRQADAEAIPAGDNWRAMHPGEAAR